MDRGGCAREAEERMCARVRAARPSVAARAAQSGLSRSSRAIRRWVSVESFVGVVLGWRERRKESE